MHTMTRWIRAATLLTILGLVLPRASDVVAQHRGKHAGQPQAAVQHKATAAPATQQARATTKSAAMNSQNSTRNTNAANPSNASIIASLHSTMTLLHQADHDYNGHRSLAMHEINTAIKQLSSSTGQHQSQGTTGQQQSGNANGTTTARSTTSANGKATGTGLNLPQATSDAHLTQAQQSLQTIESQMNLSGIHPQQFTSAKTSVQTAIRELNLALNDR